MPQPLAETPVLGYVAVLRVCQSVYNSLCTFAVTATAATLWFYSFWADQVQKAKEQPRETYSRLQRLYRCGCFRGQGTIQSPLQAQPQTLPSPLWRLRPKDVWLVVNPGFADPEAPVATHSSITALCDHG